MFKHELEGGDKEDVDIAGIDERDIKSGYNSGGIYNS